MEADYKITYVGYIETDEEKLEVNAAGFVDVLITLADESEGTIAAIDIRTFFTDPSISLKQIKEEAIYSATYALTRYVEDSDMPMAPPGFRDRWK